MPCIQSVTISRCCFRSSAIKFGSTTPVDIHDLLFDDIVIWDSNAGLSIQVCMTARSAATFFKRSLARRLLHAQNSSMEYRTGKL